MTNLYLNPPKQQKTTENSICVVENSSYTVINSVELVENIGCHLAKNGNGYTILGFVGDKITKIKDIQNLKTDKIQARLSEKLDEISRYIIRAGENKLIVEVKDNNIKYVMDLC